MGRKAASGTMLMLLLSTLLMGIMVLQPVPVTAALDGPVHNIDTGLNYTTIQAAIDASETSDGHKILVDAGTYPEQITVSKSITLQGEDRETTVINGSGVGYVVTITANNVTFSGFTVRDAMISGIYLDEYTSGNVVSDNIIIETSGVRAGIYLDKSSNNTVSDNIISNNSRWGIYVYDHSSNNNISGNTISNNSDNGIYVYENSEKNIIQDNTVTDNGYLGIFLSGSKNNFLNGNNMSGNRYNFGVTGYVLSDLIQDVDTSNMVDGKSIYYWVNQHDKEVPADAGCVAIINSTNITVKNLNLAKNRRGVLFAFTNNSTVTNVNSSRNLYGIYLYCSSNNSLQRNIIANNTRGIELYSGIGLYSSNNNITGNNLINNSYGILFAETWPETIKNNIIYHNNFINNINKSVENISDIFSTNIWDNGYPSGGNYWSDYNGTDLYSGPQQNETGSDGIGDTQYEIGVNNTDRYPLMDIWVPEHDLVVSLEAPSTLASGYSSLLNATVANMGLRNETNLELLLMINGSIVNSTAIPLLPVGSPYTLSFPWTPTAVGTYNITAYAPPLYEEEYTENNEETKFVTVSELPEASFEYSPFSPVVNETVTFDASTSTPNGGTIESYKWNFSDGNVTTATEPIITHAYANSGPYNVTLKVTDNYGLTNSTTKTVTIQRLNSTISINVHPTTATVGSDVTINGTITPTRASVNVTIHYKLAGETNWTTLTTNETDSNSNYVYTWTTTETGTFEVKANWPGDANTLPAESTTKTVEVEEQPTNIFPYVTVGIAIIITAVVIIIVIYLTRIRKH